MGVAAASPQGRAARRYAGRGLLSARASAQGGQRAARAGLRPCSVHGGHTSGSHGVRSRRGHTRGMAASTSTPTGEAPMVNLVCTSETFVPAPDPRVRWLDQRADVALAQGPGPPGASRSTVRSGTRGTARAIATAASWSTSVWWRLPPRGRMRLQRGSWRRSRRARGTAAGATPGRCAPSPRPTSWRRAGWPLAARKPTMPRCSGSRRASGSAGSAQTEFHVSRALKWTWPAGVPAPSVGRADRGGDPASTRGRRVRHDRGAVRALRGADRARARPQERRGPLSALSGSLRW